MLLGFNTEIKAQICVRIFFTVFLCDLHPALIVAGKINERNIERILNQTSAKEFHCSARKSENSVMEHRNNNG